MKQWISYILVGISIFQLALPSKGLAAPSCEQIFSEHTLRFEDLPVPYLQKNLEAPQNFIHSYLAQRAWSRINPDRLAKDLSPQELKDITDEVYNSATLDWLKPLKSKDRVLEVWVEKQILAHGFARFLTEHVGPSKPREGWIRGHIRKILQSKPFQLLLNPIKTLTPRDVALSKKMVENLIVDGYAKHADEIQGEYARSGQKKVEFYKNIARAVTLALLAYTAYDTLIVQPVHIKEVTVEKQKEAYFQSLEDFNKKLDQLDQALEQRGLYK